MDQWRKSGQRSDDADSQAVRRAAALHKNELSDWNIAFFQYVREERKETREGGKCAYILGS